MSHKNTSKCFRKFKKCDDKKYQENHETVHEKNLYIASIPLIFVFNILRSFIYVVLIIFRYVWRSVSKVLIFKKVHTPLDPSLNFNYEKSELICQELINRMSKSKKYNSPQATSGDPLLMKQKEHHRRAFEFISKALKIDEENEGEFVIQRS